MSTNKTQNYALHSWLPTDDFQLSEVNQNFAALDAALWTLTEVTGSYVGTYDGSGNETPTQVSLGFRPKAVLVLSNAYQLDGAGFDAISLALDGVATGDLTITDTGFIARNCFNRTENYASVNNHVNPYRYIAWR